ncbi:hypothetical protein NA56DRAFT_122063 [Hyaloscypha hepaticicola]|uniref:Uncharacterized protein n=1 Tax=Hyaloscypha hepaticicola TaxID=2082293 RepID=A0A2J6Q635_9HELO|nr:hypothetical protein NA56DRAFT_122063 [Hyaloscypha hepaticicola]
MSISSITSLSTSSPLSTKAHTYAASTTDLSRMSSNNTSTALPPPRKSSRLASNLSSLVTNTKSSFHSASQSAHTFLYSDPFATPTSSTSTSYIPPSRNTYDSKEDKAEEQRPKTPTSIAAWKKGFLSKARKPSMPKISLAYTAGVVRPRENSDASSSKANLSNASPPPTEPEKETSEPIEASESEPKSLRMSTSPLNTSSETRFEAKDSEKITYDDIMKAAGEVIPSPTSMSTPKERRAMSFSRLVRTKSGKGRAAKSQSST